MTITSSRSRACSLPSARRLGTRAGPRPTPGRSPGAAHDCRAVTAWPEAPSARRLDGNRLHLAHGPIDLVIAAFGPPASVERAYRAATAAFDGLLDSLVAVLPRLRQTVG